MWKAYEFICMNYVVQVAMQRDVHCTPTSVWNLRHSAVICTCDTHWLYSFFQPVHNLIVKISKRLKGLSILFIKMWKTSGSSIYEVGTKTEEERKLGCPEMRFIFK